MRLHLRFNNKDEDLCRWRHSIKGNLLTEYICRIVTAESKGQIAYIPNAQKSSSKQRACDITVYISDEDAVQYILSIPQQRRNRKIKAVIRKHLQSQDYASREAGKSTSSPERKTQRITSTKDANLNSTRFKNTTAKKEPVHHETEEDRAALMALIAMSGE